MGTALGIGCSLNLQHSIDESASQGPRSITIATMRVSILLNNFAIHTFLHLFNLRRNIPSAIFLLTIDLIVVLLLSQPPTMCVLQEGDIPSSSCRSFLSICFSFQVHILVTPTTPLVGLQHSSHLGTQSPLEGLYHAIFHRFIAPLVGN